MRNWLNATRSYIEPVEIGATMRALGIGHVIDSKDPKFKPGDLVSPITPGTQSPSRIRTRARG